MRKKCRHCRKKPASRPRGLCWGCFQEPAIRKRYPAAPTYKPGEDFYGEPNPPPCPTSARGGTAQKLSVLAQRATLRTSLWHPEDGE